MFTEEMIAPCGLDCSLCWKAQEKENPCGGCLGPEENKPEFCRSRCTIILCERLKREGYRFCDECPEYPCEACREREERYQSQYALKESPRGNLERIRGRGWSGFCSGSGRSGAARTAEGPSRCTMGFAGTAGGSWAPDREFAPGREFRSR